LIKIMHIRITWIRRTNYFFKSDNTDVRFITKNIKLVGR